MYKNPVIIVSVMASLVSIITQSWIPIYIVIGIFTMSVLLAVYMWNKRNKLINVYYIINREEQFVSDKRFKEIKQEEKEILH